MKKHSILFLCLIPFSYCTHTPEFHKLTIDSTPLVAQMESANRRPFFIEYFVISNAPRNYDKIKNSVDSFNNAQSFLPDSLQQYTYKRYFYKETRRTNRNYREGVKHRDYIEDHWDDMILSAEWSKSAHGLDIHYTFFKNENILNERSIHIFKPFEYDSNDTVADN